MTINQLSPSLGGFTLVRRFPAEHSVQPIVLHPHTLEKLAHEGIHLRSYGDFTQGHWDDLNIPARLATLAVSGLPQLQGDNTGSIVASQTLVRRLDTGFFFHDMQKTAFLGRVIASC